MKHAYFLYTGYGKTKLVLDKIMQTKQKTGITPKTLLISTNKIVESSWLPEINKWYPNQLNYGYITGSVKPTNRQAVIDSDPDILGINVEMLDWYIANTLPIKRKSYLKNKQVKLHYDTDVLLDRFHLLVIDEVSLFKNSNTTRFKNLKKWAYRMPNVILLSATPTPKNIENIWSQIYLLDGGMRLGSSITKFRESYGIAIPMSNGLNRYDYSTEAINEVLELIKDIATSIPEPATPLFPEPVIKKTVIKTDEATQELLKEFKNNYIIKVKDGNTSKELIAFSKNQLINKVNQIASGSVYLKDEVVHFNDLKIKALQHIISTITTPVLVLYTYVFDKEKLLTLPGARLLETAQDFEDWNNNKIKLAILSPFSSAHGLNLQHSDSQDIIWFSPIWDTERWIQTNARVCRRGQTRVVNIRVLVLQNSFDDYMFSLCLEKFNIQWRNLHYLQNK